MGPRSRGQKIRDAALVEGLDYIIILDQGDALHGELGLCLGRQATNLALPEL